ncbi:MAG: ComEC/Rec2 family competence protein [Pseudomonadota bacterium]
MRGRGIEALDRILSTERLQLVLWGPVLLGCGIAVYFALAVEPPVWSVAALPLSALLALTVRRLPWRYAALALMLIATGYSGALARAHLVAAPVLAAPVELTLEGRVREITRSQAGHRRLLLDRVRLHGLPAAAWPARLRVTLLPEDAARRFPPGQRVMLHARLAPPSGPVEPGGFDFRRMAWFDRLGAIGLARGRVLTIAPQAETGWIDRARLALAGWRVRLSERLRAALPDETGSFAAAILVGDRVGLPEAAIEALRQSNLAHLLAISGLHMGLLTGFVFVGLRLILALIPPLARSLPVKRAAALGAIAAGLAYLLLSGGAVATQRSFIMVLVVFIAVLVDRPAISMRSVALAATLILIATPESLVEVGFQMSFAATTALVAAYEALRGQRWSPAGRGLLRGAATLCITSFVAGLATAPISAATFHQTAVYGLPANLVAVPLMGLLIMPAGALAAPLSLIGLEGPALWLMGEGIGWVLAIARFFAGLDGAVRHVAEPGVAVLVPLALGGLWLCLWKSRWRVLGAVAILAGLIWWSAAPPRPELLITASGRQIGLMGPQGRAVFVGTRERWAVGQWLEADGDPAPLAEAALRPGLMRERHRATGVLGAWRVELLTGRKVADLAASLCTERVLLIAPNLSAAPKGTCHAITRDVLSSGAIAVRLGPDGPEFQHALRVTRRIWSGAGG